ncbi:hypothetical protein LTR55_012144, partial [Exophiala xenobiotica]
LVEVALSGPDICTRLARAYGMDRKIAEAHSIEARSTVGSLQSLADTFEAYFGLLLREIFIGTLSLSALIGYFLRLLSSDVFPDLKNRIEAAHEADVTRRQGSADQKPAKRARKDLERSEHADFEAVSSLPESSQRRHNTARSIERTHQANLAASGDGRTIRGIDESAMLSAATYYCPKASIARITSPDGETYPSQPSSDSPYKSTVCRKRHRASPPQSPSQATAWSYANPPKGANIPFFLERLRPLLRLRQPLEQFTYIRHRSRVALNTVTVPEAARLHSHQRHELLGDGVIEVCVRHWVVNHHPYIHKKTAA